VARWTPNGFPDDFKIQILSPMSTALSVKRASRWKGGPYDPGQTRRMQALSGIELASFLRRASALGIDVFALLVVFLSFAVPVAIWGERSHRSMHITFQPFHNWYSTLLPVVYFGLFAWGTNGRTPGKWLAGIRIVSLAHDRISLWHSLERSLGYGASLLEGGFGFLQYLTHPNRQTVHDRIAETIVVRVRR
jgi:uncharacterized RDD family membrane protein YckC